MLKLDSHDEKLVEEVRRKIGRAVSAAHAPSAVVKRISVLTTRHRNRGRLAAMKRHPFNGVCEASGAPLDRKHACLDELEPERGYDGRVRWVCPRANNSGTYSCGVCE